MARSSLKNVMRLIDNAIEQSPVEQSFLNDLKRSIEMTDVKNRRQPSQTYKPSSLHCIRQMYYQVTGKQADEGNTNYCLVGICNSGTDTHQRIQGYVLDMKNNGIDCEYINVADYVKSRNLDYLEIVKEPNFEKGDYETKLYNKTLNMSFLCDGIIRYNNHYYILEIKTESANKFWNRNEVNPGHYNQAIAYSTCLGIDEVLFLYISRDTLDMKTFIYKVSNDMKQNLVGKIEECDGYVKRLIAPPKPDDIDRRTCEYCGYRTQCRKDK